MKITDIENHKLFTESIKQLNILHAELKIKDGYSAHNHQHILFLIKELLGSKCKNYLEIGTALGSSMSSVMKSKYNTNFYGIDLFKKETGSDVKSRVESIIESFNVNNHNFTLIEGSSMDDSIIKSISEIQGGIDFFYIDGNHSTEYVYNDFINYETYLNKNCVIVFDDSTFGPTAAGIRKIKENDIMKNYIDLGRIPPDAYISKLEKVLLTNINENGSSIYKYNSDQDDISRFHDNWQRIFFKL